MCSWGHDKDLGYISSENQDTCSDFKGRIDLFFGYEIDFQIPLGKNCLTHWLWGFFQLQKKPTWWNSLYLCPDVVLFCLAVQASEAPTYNASGLHSECRKAKSHVIKVPTKLPNQSRRKQPQCPNKCGARKCAGQGRPTAKHQRLGPGAWFKNLIDRQTEPDKNTRLRSTGEIRTTGLNHLWACCLLLLPNTMDSGMHFHTNTHTCLPYHLVG